MDMKNKIIKQYLLPTNQWLKPLNILAKTTHQILDAELIEPEIKKKKILVKFTKTDSAESNAEFVYSFIKESPHVIKIYNFITCWEDPITLGEKYKKALGFCKGGPVDTVSSLTINQNYQMIHLELMEKYSGSLNEFIKELSLGKTIRIIRQIICIQLELFCSYGFTHGDIHTGNVLLTKTANPVETFQFCGETKQIKTDVKLLLTDFEYSKIYSEKLNKKIKVILTNPNELKLSNTIQAHMLNTFREFLKLIKDLQLQNTLNEKLEKWIETDFLKYRSKCSKPLFEYANKMISEHLFISKSWSNSMEIVSDLFELLFKQEF